MVLQHPLQGTLQRDGRRRFVPALLLAPCKQQQLRETLISAVLVGLVMAMGDQVVRDHGNGAGRCRHNGGQALLARAHAMLETPSLRAIGVSRGGAYRYSLSTPPMCRVVTLAISSRSSPSKSAKPTGFIQRMVPTDSLRARSTRRAFPLPTAAA